MKDHCLKKTLSIIVYDRLTLPPMPSHPMREGLMKKNHKSVTKYTELWGREWQREEQLHSITVSVVLFNVDPL